MIIRSGTTLGALEGTTDISYGQIQGGSSKFGKKEAD
jgi:hypothetical protein